MVVDYYHEIEKVNDEYLRCIEMPQKSIAFVNYINNLGVLKTQPLELFLELEGRYFCCQFKEPAFIVGFSVNSLMPKDLFGNGVSFIPTFTFTPFELHFMTNGYFKEQFLTENDYRKTDSLFVMRDPYS